MFGSIASCACGSATVFALGSPWLAAKALAVAAPAAMLLALIGALGLVARDRRVEGAVLLTALVAGVLGSNALAARDASLAPYDQLSELEAIGSRFAGTGPALMTEYQPYGARHFLRELDAEGASELRRRPVPLRDGSLPAKGESPDLGDLDPHAVLVYRTLVLLRSQELTPPPAAYELRWRGRFYDVWQRGGVAPAVGGIEAAAP